MVGGQEVYYKVRDIVRRQGHPETESCRVYKDWHIELRVGTGHVSVWTSQGLVYLTMLERPVYYREGLWEEHLGRLHLGRPVVRSSADLREILRTQAMESEVDELGEGDVVERERVVVDDIGPLEAEGIEGDEIGTEGVLGEGVDGDDVGPLETEGIEAGTDTVAFNATEPDATQPSVADVTSDTESTDAASEQDGESPQTASGQMDLAEHEADSNASSTEAVAPPVFDPITIVIAEDESPEL